MGYGPEWGMMGGWGGASWIGPFNMIIWLVILALIIAGVVWLMRSNTRTGRFLPTDRRSSGLDILEERYARGEIDRDEYVQKKKDLLG